MARKKKPEKHANHERWLVSYADFITLLFAVFVTLYAMSQTDKKKVDQVAASYRSAFGISAGQGTSSTNILNSSDIMPLPSLDIVPAPPSKTKKIQEDGDENKEALESGKKPQINSGQFQDIKKSIKISLKSLQLVGDIVVEESSRGLAIRLEEEVFFESGSATIKQEALPLIGKIAGAISSFSNQQIRIEGHTDSTPVATARYKSNWELSLDRSANVMRVFLANYDFSPLNISIAGYGQYRPIASNDTEAGRKRNRRVDIVLLEGRSDKPLL
ncbi:MAG: OmpA family protein [Proteobacteria bacterium]|nr:OmpA family protein [Pseudomonadota bacterium]